MDGMHEKNNDLASDLFRQSVGLSGDYVRQMGSATDSALSLAGDFVGEIGSTSRAAMNLTNDANSKLASMTGRAFDLSSSFAEDGAKLARDAMQYGGELSRHLAQSVGDANKTAQQTVLDGTKYALQFADNASRSDGQQYALSANKNQMYTMLGVAALVALVLFTRGK